MLRDTGIERVRLDVIRAPQQAEGVAGDDQVQKARHAADTAVALRRTDVGGRIVLSTDQSHEDMYRVRDSFFIEGRKDTYVQNVYPGIKTEAENAAICENSGFEVLGVEPLPARAWWDNYYAPLRLKIDAIEATGDSVMQTVIEETLQEMDFFERYHAEYGYSFYLLRAV